MESGSFFHIASVSQASGPWFLLEHPVWRRRAHKIPSYLCVLLPDALFYQHQGHSGNRCKLRPQSNSAQGAQTSNVLASVRRIVFWGNDEA